MENETESRCGCSSEMIDLHSLTLQNSIIVIDNHLNHLTRRNILVKIIVIDILEFGDMRYTTKCCAAYATNSPTNVSIELNVEVARSSYSKWYSEDHWKPSY